MLNKLITNLKQALPEPLRKKLGVEESSNEESAEYSEEQNEESHDSSNKEGEPSPEEKKKKQITMIIRVIAIVALGYMGVTEFILKEDNTVPTVTVKPRRPRKKVAPVAPGAPGTKAEEIKTAEAKPTAETKPAEAKVEEKPAVAQAPTTPTMEVNQAGAQAQAPIENVNIAAKSPSDAQVPTMADRPQDQTPIIQTPPSPAEAAPQVGEVKSEIQVEKSLDSLIDSVDNKEKPAEENAPKKQIKLEDKIVADDVYTPPPAYDQLGRGLVYNCKDKYWACLDKKAYVTCNKNMKWNKAHGKVAECAVQNVYNSDDDCGVVQKYNISTNKPTTFCQ